MRKHHYYCTQPNTIHHTWYHLAHIITFKTTITHRIYICLSEMVLSKYGNMSLFARVSLLELIFTLVHGCGIFRYSFKSYVCSFSIILIFISREKEIDEWLKCSKNQDKQQKQQSRSFSLYYFYYSNLLALKLSLTTET